MKLKKNAVLKSTDCNTRLLVLIIIVFLCRFVTASDNTKCNAKPIVLQTIDNVIVDASAQMCNRLRIILINDIDNKINILIRVDLSVLFFSRNERGRQ